MLKIEYHGQFKKDYKLAVKRGYDIQKLKNTISLLVAEKHLSEKFNDHALNDSRDYKNMRECHIEPDWLLIYQINKKKLLLNLVRTGSHSDLF